MGGYELVFRFGGKNVSSFMSSETVRNAAKFVSTAAKFASTGLKTVQADPKLY